MANFTVEFPWEVGAATNLLTREEFRESLRVVHRLSEEQLDRMAGKTNLLQIRIGEHPLYGKGVHSTLELPMAPDDPATVHMVNALNAWELSVADLPPHFGAWCIGNRAPGSYVSFMPTQFCIPGLLHLTIWMAARQARVRECLHAPPSRH